MKFNDNGCQKLAIQIKSFRKWNHIPEDKTSNVIVVGSKKLLEGFFDEGIYKPVHNSKFYNARFIALDYGIQEQWFNEVYRDANFEYKTSPIPTKSRDQERALRKLRPGIGTLYKEIFNLEHDSLIMIAESAFLNRDNRSSDYKFVSLEKFKATEKEMEIEMNYNSLLGF